MYEIEKLKALLQAERSKSELMVETIGSLRQDKELLQQELAKKAELICDFLQDQLRPGNQSLTSQHKAEYNWLSVCSLIMEVWFSLVGR